MKPTRPKWIIQLLTAILFLAVPRLTIAAPNIANPDEGLVDLVSSIRLTSHSIDMQADIEIKGRIVLEGENMGLPGVTVMEKGTNNGSISDLDGRYSISVTGRDAVLVFSYVGFDTQEITVGSRAEINVSLVESIDTMGEVVVTALGIKREKRSLGYSIGEVKGDDMVDVAQENMLNSLAGKVSGLSISQTSGPGSSVSVVIRGATSLSNDNQPLFVVDGVPMVNQLNNVKRQGDRNEVDYGNIISDINPEDIESVSVLKGPSAAALYGSRAGNGVILITTKSGKEGEGLGISFSTSNVVERPYRYLDLHYRYANGNRQDRYDEGSAYWGGPELDKGILAPQWNSPLDENGNKIPIELKGYPNNMKNFLETGITSNNNLAVSGSSALGSFRVAYDRMDHKGMIPNTDLKRNSINTSGSYKLASNLEISTNLNFLRSQSDNRASTGRGTNPLAGVYQWSNIDIRELKDYWVDGGEHIQQRTPNINADNPYFLANGITNAFVRDHAYGNIRVDWTIIPGLTAFGRVAHDASTENRESKLPWSYTRETEGAYYMDDFSNRETNMDALLTYAKTIKDFDLSVSVGGNSMFRSGSSFSMGGRMLSVPGLYRISNIATSARISSNYTSEKRVYSAYGLASLGYKNMLYLDVTGRNDWSSTLPIENRSYFYPSASMSWLANYTFNMPSNITLLKFRGGWAQVGNDTNPYQLNNALGTGSWGDLITTGMPGTLLSPTLKPEIATSQEFGLDINLYDDRIRFEGTYFYVENSNQILDVKTAPSSGYSASKINAGLLASKGWELTLGGSPLKSAEGLNLDISVNWTRTRTTIKELVGDMEYFQFWSENGGGAYTWIGEEIGDLYSRGYVKVTNPESQYYGWPILDRNGEWQRNDGIENMEKVGNYNPKFVMGSQISLSYKRFRLSASFDWRNGGDFMSWTYRYAESSWLSQRQLDQMIPRGNMTEDEFAALLQSDPEQYILPRNGNYPRVGGHTQETGGMLTAEGVYDGGFTPGVRLVVDPQTGGEELVPHLGHNPGFDESAGTVIIPITDMYSWRFNQSATFDASYVKLRELSLGYRFSNVGAFKNINLSVYTRNVMLWTKAKIGIDPERAFKNDNGSFQQGIEHNNVLPWTVPVGFKLNFNL